MLDTPCLRAAARDSSSYVAESADVGIGETGTSLTGAESTTDMVEKQDEVESNE